MNWLQDIHKISERLPLIEKYFPDKWAESNKMLKTIMTSFECALEEDRDFIAERILDWYSLTSELCEKVKHIEAPKSVVTVQTFKQKDFF